MTTRESGDRCCTSPSPRISLSREISLESEGLLTNGLTVLRLLRWHGPKTINAIADFLGVSWENANHTVAAMLAHGAVTQSALSEDEQRATIELAPAGVLVLRKIIVAQRKRVETALERVPHDRRPLATDACSGLAARGS